MEKADALQLMKLDLEDTVSVMKKEEYEKALQRAKTPADLKTLNFRVRADTKLRNDHKNQVLQRIDRSIRRAESATTPGEGTEKADDSANPVATVPLPRLSG